MSWNPWISIEVHFQLFLSYPQSFMISLISSVINSVKSHITSGQFSLAGIYCLWLDGFHRLFSKQWHLHWWRLLDFHDVFFVRVLLRVVENPLHRVVCVQFSSVQSLSHVDYLWPHGLQHCRLPYPSVVPGSCSNSSPLSWWCHPTISSSVDPFSSQLQSFLESESFPMSSSSHQVAKVLELQLQH